MKRILTAMAAMTLATGMMAHLPACADEPVGGDNDTIKHFSKASQALYAKISASLIRVKLEHNPAAMLTQDMQKEFEEWQHQQGADTAAPKRPLRGMPGATEARGRPGRMIDRDPANAPSTQPGTAFGGAERDLRRFLEEKAAAATDPETAARLRRMATVIDAVRGAQPTESIGVVIDGEGHAIVLGSGLRDTQKPIAVIGPDGKEATAKYIGSHLARGLTIIKLESASIAPPLEFASAKPEAGEMLMCVSGNSGATGWITVPGRGGKRADDRFAVFGAEDHAPLLLFNAEGKLAAVGSERFALQVAMLKENIGWIIKNQTDLKPRQLGLKYNPVPQDSPLRTSNPLVGKQEVVVVDDVIKGSRAERAGLQKGDLLVTIDRRPLPQILQILSDLATRTGNVPLGIVRDNKEITLDMPLEQDKPAKSPDQ